MSEIKAPFRPGDIVMHGPTGEEWVVVRSGYDSHERSGYVEPGGWPACRARADDCTLVRHDAGWAKSLTE